MNYRYYFQFLIAQFFDQKRGLWAKGTSIAGSLEEYLRSLICKISKSGLNWKTFFGNSTEIGKQFFQL